MKEEIEYINKFQYRLKVMKTLDGNVKIPSEIANDTEIFQTIYLILLDN